MMNWNDWFGSASDPGWIVVYVIVALIVLGAILAVAMKKKRELNHAHAEALRTSARRDAPRLEQKEAETRRLEAESAEARAEADRREALARDQREKLDSERERYTEQLREADRIDPHASAKHRSDGPVSDSDVVSDRSTVSETETRTDVDARTDPDTTTERHDVSH